MIDLSQIPAPDVVEALDFETILAAMLDDLKIRDPAFSALVESDPAYKVLEVAAYRELLLRQRINESARAVMLASATGADLDGLGAFYNLARQVVDPGDPAAVPPVAPTLEDNERFRSRIQLAPEAITTAGSDESYIFHALSAGANVKDVDVSSPAACQVAVSVLSTAGDGAPDQALLDAVDTALQKEKVRPLTDQVTVAAPTITNYTVDATIYCYEGPDAEVARQAAEDAVTKFTEDHHRLGHDIRLSGLMAALHQNGVQRVELAQPAADLVISADEAPYCTAINVVLGGTDE